MGVQVPRKRRSEARRSCATTEEEWLYQQDAASDTFLTKLAQWRDRSLTLLYLHENAQRLHEACSILQRGVKGRALQSHKLRRTGLHAQLQGAERLNTASPYLNTSNDVVLQASKSLDSSQSTKSFTGGAVLLGGLLYMCGARPQLLPFAFVLFFCIAFPWRVWEFHKRRWTFFLIDFCYFANLATFVHLVFFPTNQYSEACVSALADGPLAAALLVWQCAWVFGSPQYIVSVLIHLLPGLALFAHRAGGRGPQPTPSSAWMAYFDWSHKLPSEFLEARVSSLLWLLAAPLAFYCAWQLLYFLIVQVCFRRFILQHHYETSYIQLARRAAKTNNFWNRLVRRGSALRRCVAYGTLQLVFTLLALMLFIPTYFYFPLGYAWQVVKFVAPVYYGSKYQCEKLPKHIFLNGVRAMSLAAEQRALANTN